MASGNGLKVAGGNAYYVVKVGKQHYQVSLCGAYAPQPKGSWKWAVHEEPTSTVVRAGKARTWAEAQRAAFRATERLALEESTARKTKGSRRSPED